MGEHDDLLRRLRSREPGQAVTDVTNGSGDRSSDPGTLVANRNWVPVATMREPAQARASQVEVSLVKVRILPLYKISSG